MGDPWQDEGFGGGNDWDEGAESLATDLEEGLEAEVDEDDREDDGGDE